MDKNSLGRDPKALEFVLKILNISVDEYSLLMFELGIEKLEKHHSDKIDVNKTVKYWEWVYINFSSLEIAILSLHDEYKSKNYNKKLMQKFYNKTRNEYKEGFLNITISKERWVLIDAEYNEKFCKSKKEALKSVKKKVDKTVPKVKNNQLEINLNAI